MAVFPSVDLTNFDLAPAVRQVRDAGDAVTSAAVDATRDAAYTAIGLGILTYQRIQVRRREIEKTLRD
ncbi:MAG: hypothetical protein WA964_00755 [Ilumatobacter sp.]|uniref:hypothetical protein n=1 Tax=Ilumatobacter sp. TaxID=1967498 RepID=UPI003C76871A